MDGAVETKNLQTFELIGSIDVIFEQAGLYIILFRDFLGGEWNAFLDTGDNSINNGIKFFIKELIVRIRFLPVLRAFLFFEGRSVPELPPHRDF